MNHDCPICLDEMNETKNKTITDCGHKFHTSCLMQNISLNGFGCPYCREKLFKSTKNDNVRKVVFISDLNFIENENYIFDGFRCFHQRNNNEQLEEITNNVNIDVNISSVEYENSHPMATLQDVISELNKSKIKKNELIEYILEDFKFENLGESLKNKSFKTIYTKLREIDSNHRNKLRLIRDMNV
jgi:hypothetical protein